MTTTALAERESVRRDGRGGRGGWAAGLLVRPAVIAVIAGALWWYLHGQQLDDIERRSINGPVISQLLWQHVQLTAVSSLAVIVIAVPLGVLLTRHWLRRAGAPILAVANIGQAIPSIGVLVLLAVAVGIGFREAVFALVLASVLPVLRNTMVGLTQVDRSLIDAGRGMGMTRTAVLFRVELPLAVPVILAGIRIALILNVGSATLATFTNAGGLGTLINSGIAFDRMPVLITGSVLTALLALTVDWLGGLAERILRPRGL
ncbi:MAG TPA: ABC transporter permease [Pseudonocardiaceae bacterium]|jgi:osmoprotectant transport system permease protein|nr:ABC transporter permease [Pseudonocardiaceae bacterium]